MSELKYAEEQSELATEYIGNESQALAVIDHESPLSLGPIESQTQLQQADPYFGAGALDLTDKQSAILARPFDPSQLEILPTGEVYAPQVEYRRRFNEAFGIGRWALRPLADPKITGKTVVRWYALYINGKFAAETFGEADFIENNPRFTWGTALESAKSNALMRCGKDIGVNLECWSKSFTAEWKKKYARRDSDGKWQKQTQGMDGGREGQPATRTDHTTSSELVAPASEKGSANTSASSPTNESAAPLPSSSKSIRPVSIGDKKWKFGSEDCGKVLDANDREWTFVGTAALDAARFAIFEKKQLLIQVAENKKGGKTYYNVVKAEVME